MPTKIIPPVEPVIVELGRRRRRKRALWRVCGWGCAAGLALAAVVVVSQSDEGAKRLQIALAFAGEPIRTAAVVPVPPRQAEAKAGTKAETKAAIDAETLRLAAQLRDLAADRARLTARIASLEQNIEDMTGSIKQQAAQIAARAAAPPPAPAAPSAVPATVVEVSPAPAAKLEAAASEPAVTPSPAAAPDSAATAPAAGAAEKIASAAPPPEAATPVTEAVPLPPVRVAEAPANGPAVEPPAKPEYGIDLGGAASAEMLGARWATVKANYGPLLVGLRPLAAPRPRHFSGPEYRLVAGPLPTIADASRLCARFIAMRATCRATKFTGEQLAQH